MSAEIDPDCCVYYCAVCGPCLQLMLDGSPDLAMTIHNLVPHPPEMAFTDEESPQ